MKDFENAAVTRVEPKQYGGHQYCVLSQVDYVWLSGARNMEMHEDTRFQIKRKKVSGAAITLCALYNL